jgi:allantoicase
MHTDQDSTPEFARRYVNLADARRGAVAVQASDEFFAPKERMLDPDPAVFIAGKYDEQGKWMDGWETRRKRGEGYDHCVVKLAYPGVIHGVDFDTSHFTGNFPPAASLEACSATDALERAQWTEIVPATNLSGNAHHYVPVSSRQAWTHLRLNIFPDGGIARLRVYGEPVRDWTGVDRATLLDLVALENGGRSIACSDQHYGTPWNIIGPGRGMNMGDGWETRRRREPGNDWAILALGRRGRVQRVEIDTLHFKGNYPDRCSLQAADVKGGTDRSLVTQAMFWRVLLPEQKMELDQVHFFESELADLGAITHVRLNLFPDGGVSRLRLYGFIE